MAKSSYDITHERILESGKSLFLKNGYERTNLRELCKNAGVTTGAFYRHFEDKESLFAALVDSVILGMDTRYDKAKSECLQYIKDDDMDNLWAVSAKVQEDFIHYIYQNHDAFKLLLECAEGTKYQDFMNTIVEKEMKEALALYNFLDSEKIPYRKVGLKEMHMLIHANYACIFETVLHDMTLEEAVNAVKVMTSFFAAGWREVMEIKDAELTTALYEKINREVAAKNEKAKGKK